MKLLTSIRQGLADLVYPPLCRLCEAPLPEGTADFCATCHAELMGDAAPTCGRCGATVGLYADTTDGCVRCRGDVLHFQGAFRLGSYEGLLREAILRIKREEGDGLANALGRLLLEKRRGQIAALPIQAVIPVPLHWLRRLRRGYNQAQAVATPVAAGLEKRLRTSWLRRVKHTPAQTSLTPAERRQSPKQAFRARVQMARRGQGVLLVDDVLTTGSTASAAARALRSVGCGPVWVAFLGKAVS